MNVLQDPITFHWSLRTLCQAASRVHDKGNRSLSSSAKAVEKAGPIFHVARGDVSSRGGWAAQGEKGCGEPEEVGVNSVVSQPVSIGRRRRPQAELRHRPGLKITAGEGREVGGWGEEGSNRLCSQPGERPGGGGSPDGSGMKGGIAALGSPQPMLAETRCGGNPAHGGAEPGRGKVEESPTAAQKNPQ